MATTALFVEIVVIGAIAELWVVSLVLACVNTAQVKQLFSEAIWLKDFGPAVVLFVLAITYGVGWVANFASESIFKRVFESRLRDPLFWDTGFSYEQARLMVLKDASSEFWREVQLDRHIIRIARTNTISFALLALSLLLHSTRIDSGALAILCGSLAALAFGSFYQWRARYTFQYRQISAFVKERLAASSVPSAPANTTEAK